MNLVSLQKLAIISLTIGGLAACNTEGLPKTSEEPEVSEQGFVVAEKWWDVPSPDLKDSPEKPKLSLVGQSVLHLNIGEEYLEPGAVGTNSEGIDISDKIEITTSIDTNQVGDYHVRYQLMDEQGNNAVELTRIVRVYDQSPNSLTKHVLGNTQANIGYWEHLPDNYAENAEQNFPLLIYFHDDDANAEHTNVDSNESLDIVADNGGPITMLKNNSWDRDLPFIVITPHIGIVSPQSDYLRLDAFVEYLKHTYKVDEQKIYMAGWGYGGSIAYNYIVKASGNVAAMVSVAGSYPWGSLIPEELCEAEDIPIWLFHGNNDAKTHHSKSIAGQTRIVDNCQPTVIPKVTIILNGEHDIHHSVFDLTAMKGGAQGYEFDERYDEYDQNIYQWLLEQYLPED